MIVTTDGYELPPVPSRSEPALIVDGNDLRIEHRFFLPSRPEPESSPDIGREAGRDRLDGVRDLRLGQGPILTSEDEPQRQAALVVGERPPAVAVEQDDGAQERSAMPRDGGRDLRGGTGIGHHDRQVALDVRVA